MSDLPVIDVAANHQQAFAIVQGQLSPGKLSMSDKTARLLRDWTNKEYDMKNPQNTAEQLAVAYLEAVRLTCSSQKIQPRLLTGRYRQPEPSSSECKQRSRKRTKPRRTSAVRRNTRRIEAVGRPW
jgi:hypothetical protein